MFKKIDEYIPERMTAEALGVVNDFSKTVKGNSTLHDPTSEEQKENMDLLFLAEKYYDAMYDVRQQYTRNLMYKNGQQFIDMIRNPDFDGCTEKEFISEYQYIMSKGRIPRQNNIINSCIRTVVGQFLSNPVNTQVLSRGHNGREGAEILTNAVQSVHEFNKYKNVRRQALNAFLTSGFGCFVTSYKYIEERDKEEIVYSLRSLYRMFWNNDIKDSRFQELRIIGELTDITIEEIVSNFAKNTADEALIRKWYTGNIKDCVQDYALEIFNERNLSFFTGNLNGTVRVIQIWYKKLEWRLIIHDPLDPDTYGSYPYSEKLIAEIEYNNGLRIEKATQSGQDIKDVPLIRYEQKKENIWNYKYLTPFGQCLREGTTPYIHQSHPYTIYAYPMEEGIIRGFVSDLIDPQRSINRDLMLIDFIISASAKGVLLVPESAIPADMDINDFAEQWSRFDGIIKYSPKPGMPPPTQVSANSTNIGIFDILKIHLSMFQDQSGITPALRGEKAASGTPSSRYAQESFNSSLNILDYIECFKDGLERTDEKILKLILQYYEDGRNVYSSGSKNNIFETQEYRKDVIGQIGYDIKIQETNLTPIYRQMMDDVLMNLFASQAIDIELMLENASFPFADKLLQQIRSKKEQSQMPQMTQEDIEAINKGASPNLEGIMNNINM